MSAPETLPARPSTVEDALLGSYSRTVPWVAGQLLPSVAALRVGEGPNRPGGAGPEADGFGWPRGAFAGQRGAWRPAKPAASSGTEH
jgi:hypothetical protein